MTRIVPLMAALIPALWLSSAAALGLGDIDVRSRLNQRFSATIPLASLQAEEAESLKIALASAAEFERAGIERSEYLSTLRFTLVTKGSPRIEVSSNLPAREPYLNFLVEIRGGGSRVLREYTVLLDPPNMPQELAQPAPRPESRPAPVAATPRDSRFYETAEEASRKPAAAEPAPAPAEAPAPAPTRSATGAAAGSERYGPVQSGETFWSIATRLRPDGGVSMDQMLLGLYQANPQAFDGGINGLRRGSTLNVPSRDQFTSVSAADAKARVADLRGVRQARKPASPKPAPAVAAVTPPAEPAPEPAPVAEPPAQKKTPEPNKPPAVAPEAVKPAAVVAAPASKEPAPAPVSPTPAPAEAPAPAPAIAEAGTTPSENPADAAVTPPAEVPPVEAPTPAPAEEPAAVVSAPVVPEEPGLLETLLVPLVGGLAVLGLIGFLAAKIFRRKPGAPKLKLGKTTPDSPPPAAIPGSRPDIASAGLKGGKAAAAASSKLSAKEELERLQDSLDETVDVGASTQQLQTQRIQTQQFATQQLSSQQLGTQTQKIAAVEQTSQLPAADATGMFEAPPPAAPEEHVDFDLTGQFESQTVSIDLDANDPLSEADFHLAYGLYDEAALLLKQAAAKEPNRSDIRVKLAETYFAAGKVAEFQSTAEGLKDVIAPADWQKLAIMGQQLCPDAPAFRDAGAGGDVGTDLDLAFDEPAADDLFANAAPAVTPPPAPEPAPATSALDDGLEFKIEDLELPSLDTVSMAVAPEKADSLEFDLGDFDLETKPKAVAPAAPAAPAGNAMEFDLGDFDLPAAKPAPAAPAAAGPRASTAGNSSVVSEIRLEDFDIGDLPMDSGEISGDEAGTKLDLARAYVDMGDNDMARSLLSEVLQQGSPAQQQEAKALIGRLT